MVLVKKKKEFGIRCENKNNAKRKYEANEKKKFKCFLFDRCKKKKKG